MCSHPELTHCTNTHWAHTLDGTVVFVAGGPGELNAPLFLVCQLKVSRGVRSLWWRSRFRNINTNAPDICSLMDREELLNTNKAGLIRPRLSHSFISGQWIMHVTKIKHSWDSSLCMKQALRHNSEIAEPRDLKLIKWEACLEQMNGRERQMKRFRLLRPRRPLHKTPVEHQRDCPKAFIKACPQKCSHN